MANKKKSKLIEGFDEKNAEALTALLVDPQTSEAVRLQIINELNETSKAQTFFESIFEEALSMGACPCCGHKNHWLIPEDQLTQMGWITSKEDTRVKVHTDADDCKEFSQACAKKKTTA